MKRELGGEGGRAGRSREGRQRAVQVRRRRAPSLECDCDTAVGGVGTWCAGSGVGSPQVAPHAAAAGKQPAATICVPAGSGTRQSRQYLVVRARAG